MAYLQSTGSQILLCLRSVGLGFLLGIGYELLRFVRLLCCAGRSCLPWDVGFGAAAGIGTFLFDLLSCDGRLRAYVLLAQCVGLGVWFLLAAPALRVREAQILRGCRRMHTCFRRVSDAAERRRTLRTAKLHIITQKIIGSLKKSEKTS